MDKNEFETVDESILHEIAAQYFGGNASQKALASVYGYSPSQISIMCKAVKIDMMHYYVMSMKDAVYQDKDQQEENNRIINYLARNYDMSLETVISVLTNEFSVYASMPQEYGDTMIEKSALFIQMLGLTPFEKEGEI